MGDSASVDAPCLPTRTGRAGAPGSQRCSRTPAHPDPDLRRPLAAWRLLAPAVFVAAGVLFVTSMVSSQGTDLRAGRYDDLDGLATNEAHDLEGLRGPQHRPQPAGRPAHPRPRQHRRRQRAAEGRGAGGPGRAAAGAAAPASRSPSTTPPTTRSTPAGDDVSDLARAPAGHPGGRQRAVGGRRRGDDDPGPAGGRHDRHQVRRQHRDPARRAVLAAVPHLRDRRPGRMLAAVDASPYIALYLRHVRAERLGWDVERGASLSHARLRRLHRARATPGPPAQPATADARPLSPPARGLRVEASDGVALDGVRRRLARGLGAASVGGRRLLVGRHVITTWCPAAASV